MNRSATPLSNTALADEDLAEQARPGYGIPSQDPRPAAQIPLEPEEAKRDAKSVLMGGGVTAGAGTGAAVGTVVAGPLGAVIGGTLGAVAGALGGAAAGTLVTPRRLRAAQPPCLRTPCACTSTTAVAAAGRSC
jgi:hypothetical protein